MSRLPILTYALDEIVALARQGSPFYRQLYADLPERPSLADLPVLNAANYWEAHSRDPRSVVTGPLEGGLVINSGGTTGAPKFSYFRYDEADTAIALTAQALENTGLRDGDRVANLFAAGYMYASFMVMTEAMKAASVKLLQYPIGYYVPVPDAARVIRECKIHVWAGFPTHLMNVANHLEQEGLEGVQVSRIVFGGEPFTPEQRGLLETRFPGVQIRSISYASVDGGVIGLATPDCGPGEHRVADGAALVEIHDEETGAIIEEPGRAGKVVYTNLTRRHMPMLRYPAGDRAEWIEPPGGAQRKFLLLDRADASVRLAVYNVTVAEIAKILEPFRAPLDIQQFQLVVSREDECDGLTIRLASGAPRDVQAPGGRDVVAAFLQQRTIIAESIRQGVVRPVQIEWVEPLRLEVNKRTGKTPAIIDRRAG